MKKSTCTDKPGVGSDRAHLQSCGRWEVVGSSGQQEMRLVRWLGQLSEGLHAREWGCALEGNGKLFDELHINAASSSPPCTYAPC